MTSTASAASSGHPDRWSAIGLLIATGIVFGAMFPLGKLAQQAGVSPLPWTLAMLLGGGLLLLLLSFARKQPIEMSRRHLRYYVIAGFFTMGLPYFILFTVMPHLGVGLSSVVYTLPPILTLTFAAMIGLERPGLRRVLGIGLGFIGAAIIAGQRSSLPSPDLQGWLILAFAIPASVAVGNIFRTRFWPPGSAALPLSAGTMLAGGIWMTLIILGKGQGPLIATLGEAPLLALLQAALNACQFLMFMRLQQMAGPVYVSQMGYVGTATGLVSGALFFGETYSPWIWAASATIAAGVLVVNSDRRA
ncbi:DMT family transporter [Microvirga flavescens]|uniref:DMT family transporter n=1 Tax=Microvirga flavescens TaxID=2249811 RepID=UPI000DD5CE05|nr:DMT family transporter [Microvirga flavescens]